MGVESVGVQNLVEDDGLPLVRQCLDAARDRVATKQHVGSARQSVGIAGTSCLCYS